MTYDIDVKFSSSPGITQLENGVIEVKLNKKPFKGGANKQLIELLSEYFSVSKNQVEIIKGFKSRKKRVKITPYE